jgi:hypothetical protein
MALNLEVGGSQRLQILYAPVQIEHLSAMLANEVVMMTSVGRVRSRVMRREFRLGRISP